MHIVVIYNTIYLRLTFYELIILTFLKKILKHFILKFSTYDILIFCRRILNFRF